jgi:hypothetical protein
VPAEEEGGASGEQQRRRAEAAESSREKKREGKNRERKNANVLSSVEGPCCKNEFGGRTML